MTRRLTAHLLLICAALLTSLSLLAPTDTLQPTAQAGFSGMPLVFEPNVGQFDTRATFAARGPGYTLYHTHDDAVFALSGEVAQNGQAHPLRMALVGAEPSTPGYGVYPQSGVSNYFIGDDESRWQTDVPHYGGVRYDGVYPGVDLVYYRADTQLQYDFILAPGADPAQIRIDFSPVDRLELDVSGDLLLHTQAGTLRQRAPFTYQEIAGRQIVVESGFVLHDDGTVGFAVGDYDADYALTIDPLLVYSTYLGGSEQDLGLDIAVDAEGYIYAAGTTWHNAGYPVTDGAFQTTYKGEVNDAFLTKLTPDGRSIVYSTYLGGTDEGFYEWPQIEVDPATGAVYLVMGTESDDYPTTANAFQPQRPALLPACEEENPSDDRCVYNTFLDAVFTVINPAGDGLLYSTYLGGMWGDSAGDLALADNGLVYILGSTSSEDFPVTSDAYQSVHNSEDLDSTHSDLFLSIIDPNQSGADSLIYSTFLGGNHGESPGYSGSLFVDDQGTAYMVGFTRSDDFPVTADAIQSTKGTGDDGFLTVLTPGSPTLDYSTYLGGSGPDDFAHAVVVDEFGAIYVLGNTDSADFPTTPGVLQEAIPSGTYPSGGYRDSGFVVKVTPTHDALEYATYLGTAGNDYMYRIAYAGDGTVYVTGEADAAGLPVMPDAFQPEYTVGYDDGGNPTEDAIFVHLNATGTGLIYGTYIGGTGYEILAGIAPSPSGEHLYLWGASTSTDFPVTDDALQPDKSLDPPDAEFPYYEAILVIFGDEAFPLPPSYTGITEEMFFNAMAAHIAAGEYEIDFVLADFRPGEIALTVRTDDGTVGAVTVRIGDGPGYAVLEIASVTVNGARPPARYTQAINTELMTLIVATLDTLFAEDYAAGRDLGRISLTHDILRGEFVE